jgi:plastocyanin
MKSLIFLIVSCALIIAGLLGAVSCSASSESATAPGTGLQTSPPPGGTTGPDYKPVAVEIKDFAFSPPTITVAIGTTVTWTNQDSVNHTVTSKTGAFESGTLSNGSSFSFTFNTAGDYEYHCSIHTGMVGQVIVQ